MMTTTINDIDDDEDDNDDDDVDDENVDDDVEKDNVADPRCNIYEEADNGDAWSAPSRYNVT